MSNIRRRRRSDTSVGDEINLGPEITGSLKNEDLYVFTVEHVTLKKGQRMVLPITEYKLKYRDVFVLNLPFGPPAEVRHRLNSEQQAQLARLFHAPKDTSVKQFRVSNYHGAGFDFPRGTHNCTGHDNLYRYWCRR